MAEDLSGVFERALSLRSILPDASLSSLLAQRPELLLHEDFKEVAPAFEGLQRLYPEVDISLAVSRQPYFLVGPVANLIEELKQLPQIMTAARQQHFMMMHLETSAILNTDTYKAHKKQALIAYSKPKTSEPLQEIPMF